MYDLKITIEEIYQEILVGKRNRFPFNTWNLDDNNEMAKKSNKILSYINFELE
ncbi:TPA: hypothetical protein ACQ75Q_003824 [Bacillus thuringiensis]|nr:hypothetical protein [Bacillus cereus]HDR4799435.1 hypothetical protein [Bacillus cereus]HDR4805572.1 hypothetical protein [Bacillus cereus]HDR4811512.1 hypothetical protein [Bacillus cereus]HDR4833985.1 hypothetical protein [Bacillus cereus]